MRRLAVAGLTALWLPVLWSSPPPAPLPAAAAGTGVAVAEEHRAAVIVDTGTSVKSVCVRFREDSISGIEALSRAQVDPVFQAFSGKGAAVCALCGVGCPAGDSCLTCNAEGRFWSYSRAPAGTTALRTSGAGASSTTVRDGDVEGWRWALGGAPPFATVEQVCGEAVPTTTSMMPAPSAAAVVTTTSADGAAVSPTTANARPGPVTTRAAGSTTTTAATTAPPAPTSAPRVTGGAEEGPASPSSSTTVPDGTGRPGALAASPTASGGQGDGAGGWPGMAAFGALLGALVGWGAWARRARRSGTTHH